MTLELVESTIAPVCGNCRHWNDKGADPQNLGAPHQGECKFILHSTAFFARNGQPIYNAYYPPVTAKFPACAQFDKRPETV